MLEAALSALLSLLLESHRQRDRSLFPLAGDLRTVFIKLAIVAGEDLVALEVHGAVLDRDGIDWNTGCAVVQAIDRAPQGAVGILLDIAAHPQRGNGQIERPLPLAREPVRL